MSKKPLLSHTQVMMFIAGLGTALAVEFLSMVWWAVLFWIPTWMVLNKVFPEVPE